MAHQNQFIDKLLAGMNKPNPNGFTASADSAFNPIEPVPAGTPTNAIFPNLNQISGAGADEFFALPSNPSLPQPLSGLSQPTPLLGAQPTPTIDPTAASAALLSAPTALPQMTPELAAQREAARGGAGVPFNPQAQSRAGQLFSNAVELGATGLANTFEVGKQIGQNIIGAPIAAANLAFSPDRPSIGEAFEDAGVGLPTVHTPQFSTSPIPATSTPAPVAPVAPVAAVAPQSIQPEQGSLGTVPFDPTLPVPEVSQADIAGAQGALTPEELAQPQAATNQGLTTRSGIPLNQFLSGDAIPDAGLVAENPLGGRGDTGAVGRQALQDAGVAAGTRAAPDGTFAPQNVGGATRRDRPEGSTAPAKIPKLSMAAAVRAQGGDRAKARAMIERQKLGLGEFAPEKDATKPVVELTPEAKAAAAAKLEGVELENTRKQQVIDAGNKPEATKFDIWNAELEQSGLSKDEMRAARLKKFGLDAFDFPAGSDTSAPVAAAPVQAPQAPTEAPTGQDAPIPFNSEAEAQAANLPSGTRVSINGRVGTI